MIEQGTIKCYKRIYRGKGGKDDKCKRDLDGRGGEEGKGGEQKRNWACKRRKSDVG